jgi:hypothetical protein
MRSTKCNRDTPRACSKHNIFGNAVAIRTGTVRRVRFAIRTAVVIFKINLTPTPSLTLTNKGLINYLRVKKVGGKIKNILRNISKSTENRRLKLNPDPTSFHFARTATPLPNTLAASSLSTSFPGSLLLSSGRDPGCGWSRASQILGGKFNCNCERGGKGACL